METSFWSGRCSIALTEGSLQGAAEMSRTLGSAMTPGVCTWTTLCTNLMQHTRTPVAAVSHLFNIFDLIEAIWFQTGTSCGFAILREKARKTAFFSTTVSRIYVWLYHCLTTVREEGLHVHVAKY